MKRVQRQLGFPSRIGFARIGLTVACAVAAFGFAAWVEGDRFSITARTVANDADDRAGGYGANKAADAIAKNGAIFQNWTKPKLALVITGLAHGYIEPCGCAGLDNQKGGLSRRHTLLKQLTAKGWPTLPIDVGGQVNRYGRQTIIKFGIALEALNKLGYQAVALGASDLKLPTDELMAATTNLADTNGESRFVSANVGLFDFDSDTIPTYRVIEEAGVRIGVTSVLGESFARQVKSDEVKLTPPAESLAKIVPELKSNSDVMVLLAHATNEEAARLAKQFPQFDIVVSAGGADEPPNMPIPVAGSKTLLVDVGHKGMYAIVLGLFDDPKKPWRYQRVPLDARFADSPDMKQLMTAYQSQLELEGFEGLGLRPTAHPLAKSPGDPLAAYAGSQSCRECHPTAYGIWSKSPHAHATETLAKLDPPRQFDPECISCHSTGWNAQEYYPYETGFASIEQTPLLQGNGCENCHGPAAAHVEAEHVKGFKNLAQREQLRQRLKLTRATIETTCERCHDHDNSPEFDFAKYWPKVEHRGKK